MLLKRARVKRPAEIELAAMRFSNRRIQLADIVIFRGRILKNRYGVSGEKVAIPDGCYRLTDLELR